MDTLIRGLSRRTKIRFLFADVTETTQALERKHLSGPSAAQVLGRALAGAALLSADLDRDDERFTLQMQVDGPVRGCLVEAARDGGLRGYTDIKILNDYDGDTFTDLTPVMGGHGRMTVIHSNARGVLYQGQVRSAPAEIRTCLARYINFSLQTPAAVELYSRTSKGYISHVSGIVAERMPDGDPEAFVNILECFERGEVRAMLADGQSTGDFKRLFDLDDLDIVETRELRFHCGCSREKILSVLASLPTEDIREIVQSGEPQHVTCHFCGETYVVQHEGMKALLQQKRDSRNGGE